MFSTIMRAHEVSADPNFRRIDRIGSELDSLDLAKLNRELQRDSIRPILPNFNSAGFNTLLKKKNGEVRYFIAELDPPPEDEEFDVDW